MIDKSEAKGNEEIDVVIASLSRKINVEYKIKEGAEAIMRKLNNPAHVEQASISVKESSKRLEFLNSELSRMEALRASSSSIIIEPQSKNDWDYCSANSPLSLDKIAYKLFEVQKKLNVEHSIVEGAEKMLLAIDKKLKADAQANILNSKAKISLLKSIFIKYSTLTVDENFSGNVFGTRDKEELFTGKIKIKIKEVECLSLPVTKGEFCCQIRIDNSLKVSTKFKSKPMWNEDFEIDVDKATELEIIICDKLFAFKGIVFLKIGSIVNGEAQLEVEPRGILKCSITASF